MKAIITILMVAFASYASAQSNFIIGRIIDKDSGKPIPKVSVYWKNDKERNRVVETNTQGIYKIGDSDSTDVLFFEQSGMEKERIPRDSIKFNECDIEMITSTTSITASRWEQSVNEAPASIIVITREEIARNGYMTVQEILENVPGLFTIDHRSESDVTIGIRGFWAPFNRNVMIQVNGVSMLNERQNDFPLNKINVAVESIDKIEIVRGPMSVMYGAGAFFGVINIITNDAGYGMSATGQGGYGTQNSQKGFLRYAVNQDGLKMTLNAMAYRRDGYAQYWDDMVNDSTYYNNSIDPTIPYANAVTIEDYQGQMINPERYSKKHQSFNFSANYKGFYTNINYAASNFGFSFIEPGPGDRNDYISKTGNFQFGYRAEDIWDKFNLDVRAAYMKSNVDAYYKFYLDTLYTVGEDRVSSIRTEINTSTILKDSENGDKIDWDILAGLSYNFNLENGSIYNQPEQNLRNWYVGLMPGERMDTRAAYLQTNIKKEINDVHSFQIVAGGRLEQQAKYEMLSDRNPDYFFTQEDTTFWGNDTIPEIDTFEIENEYVTGINERDSIYFIPRLALIYSISQKNKVNHVFKGMFGKAIKQATVVDNANDIMANDNLTVKTYLRPEEILAYEFGYTIEYEPRGLVFNLNSFYNDLNSLVTRTTEIIDGNYFAFSTNDGRIATFGTEVMGRFTKNFELDSIERRYFNLSISGSATYQKTQYRSSNETNDIVSFSPPFLATANVNGRLPISDKFSMSFGVGMNYVGAMKPYYEPESGTEANPEPGYYLGADTKGYALLSANIRFNFLHEYKKQIGNVYLNVRGSNILNSQYYYPTYTINPWADKGMLGRGRSIMLTLGYTITQK